MKRLIITAILILGIGVANCAYAQKQDSVKLTKEKIYSDVKDALQGLGKALKVGAEHVYTVMVKQQVVNSFVWLVIGIIAIISFLIAYKQIKLVVWTDYGDITKGTYNLILGIGFTVLAVILSIGTLLSLDTIIMGFVNPEYGALKDILDFVKK